MINPITKLLGVRKAGQADLNGNVMVANLNEIRVKVQCLQQHFLEQSREHSAIDIKEAKRV